MCVGDATGYVECSEWEYSGRAACSGKLQQCIDNAYWELLSGLHDIGLDRPDLTYEQVFKQAMKTLGRYQLGVG